MNLTCRQDTKLNVDRSRKDNGLERSTYLPMLYFAPQGLMIKIP